jgi:hypothetical protein
MFEPTVAPLHGNEYQFKILFEGLVLVPRTVIRPMTFIDRNRDCNNLLDH